MDAGAAFTGGAGNDTFTANNAALGTLDSIDGGAGSNTLTITDSASIPTLPITIANIQTVNATSTSGTVGAVAVPATIAAKQSVTYDVTKLTFATSGDVILNVGGVTKAITLTSTTGNGALADAMATQIEAVLDDAYATATNASNYVTHTTGATTLTVTSATAGVALPSISLVKSTAGTITTATGYATTNQANQVTAAAIDAGTFTLQAGVTSATISAASTAKVASVSTATTKVTGTDVTLSGGASQDITATGTVYASGTKGAVVVNNSAVASTTSDGLYVASSSTTGLSGGWGTAEAPVAGVLITGGSTVNYTGKGGTISSGAVSSGTTNDKAVQVGSAANKSSSGSLTGTETIRNLALNPTGDVVISTKTAYTDSSGYKNVVFGTGTAKVYTNGGSSVSVTGAGATTIVDVGTTTLIPSTGVAAVAGTSKLANVTLSGLGGNASITSDAISTVTVTDTLAARTVTINNSGTTGANAGAINLVVSNAGTASNASITLDDSTATSVNISSAAATAYDKIGSTASNTGSKSYVTLTTPKATSITLTNSLPVDIGSLAGSTAGVAKVGVVNGAGATGGITATIGAATAAGMSFTGGSGKDSVTLTGDVSVTASTVATTVNLGAGDDSLLNSSATTTFTGATFNGGDGNDTVAISLLTVGNASKFTNFETIGLDLASTGSADVSLLSGITGYSLLKATSGATATYTGVTQDKGLTVATTTAGGTTALDFGTTTTATTDKYTVTFAATGASTAAGITDVNAGTISIAGIEGVTVASGGSGYNNNIIKLLDANARTLTITGNQKTNVTFASDFGTSGSSTSSAGVSSIDASALTGKLTLVATNVKSAYAGLTVTGGSNDDDITVVNPTATGATAGYTVNAGAGDDKITTSSAGSVLTGGSGKDSFVVSATTAASTSAPVYTTITDFSAGDTITMGDALYVSSKTTGAANVSDATSLVDAFAKALHPTGGSAVANNTAVWFVYGGDTWIIANDATADFGTGDIIVKLTGVTATDLAYAGSTTGIIGAA